MPETPTPAIEAAPSLPTHIMSMVGPSILRLPLTIIGQPNETRLPTMLPLVQSLSNLPALPPPLPLLPTPIESSIVFGKSFLRVTILNEAHGPALWPLQQRTMNL